MILISLKNYVDSLFIGYKESKQIRELKDEILSNLEAKVSDLSSSGMEYKQAVQIAIENMDSVDGLIDHNKKVYINRFRIEFLQIALMYSLIAWILTIPIGGKVILLNLTLQKASLVNLGTVYCYFNDRNNSYPIWKQHLVFETCKHNWTVSICSISY
jgi:hypothetical protein